MVNGHEKVYWGEENVLQLDCGDACTTQCIYEKVLYTENR